MSAPRDLFVVCVPGLEEVVRAELNELGYSEARCVTGGVELQGDAHAIGRINLWSRCASRLLVRVATFSCQHLADLRKRAAQLDWRPFVDTTQRPLRVSASCRKSRIYHSGAAAQRVAEGIADGLGTTPPTASGDDPEALHVRVRIERNEVTLSVDSSGEHLHRRGYRLRSAKAPLRETLAASFLRLAGWSGNSALLDPMCGSGTFPIEAALIAAGIPPGAKRSFACKNWPMLPTDAFDWTPAATPAITIVASDRDAGAVHATAENAVRAGVGELVQVEQRPLSAAEPPTEHGLLITNPPYGQRVKGGRDVRDLYARRGQLASGTFAGWNIAFVTSRDELAKATRLELETPAEAVDHGGTRITLYRRCAAAMPTG